MNTRIPQVPALSLHLGLILITGSAARANFQLGTSQELTAGLTLPEVVRSVDIDGDGSLDLLASSEADGVVVWHRNLSDGAFGVKQVIAAGINRPNFVGAADLDDDGTVDIYVGSTGDGNARWYQGLGNGDFAPPTILNLNNPSQTPVTLVEAGDVDSDGDLDLIVGLSASSGLRWHENNGGGQFSLSATSLVPTFAPSSAQIGDMDGDGLQDLVYDNNNRNIDTVLFRRGLGGGDFGPAIDLGAESSSLSNLRLADFDGDSNLDIVYLSRQADLLFYIEGLGALGFGPAQAIVISEFFFNALEVCDLDSDADLDIAIGTTTGLSWIQNLGAGQFTGLNEILPSGFQRGLACGDFDRDGLVDLAYTSANDQVSWVRNLRSGVAFSDAMAVSSFVAWPANPLLADLDGDGDLDALSASVVDRRISWYQNVGGGDFAPEELLVLEEHLTDELRTGDLDGDGDLDLVWHTRGDRAIRWLEQVGPKVWAPPAEIAPLPGGPRDMALVDLDQDGDLDIVQPLTFPNGILVFENQGGAQFSGPSALPNVGIPQSLAVGALTTSTRPDLVMRAEDGRIAWYRNSGLLAFDAPVIIAQATATLPLGIDDIVLADLTGNGRLDPIWTDENEIQWRENQSLGVFGATQIAPVNAIANFLEVVDFDTDGDSDLLVSPDAVDPEAPNVVILENRDGLLSPPQSIANTSFMARKVATGDIDGDGDIDALLAYTGTFELEWRPGEELDIVGMPYCGPAVANSTGQSGSAFASGSTISTSNDFTLHARQLPPEMVGIFLVSPNQGLVTTVPGSVGALCLGASIGRFNMPGQVLITSLTGTASLSIELDAIASPNGTVAVQPGDTWNFQLWHRDQDPSATSNFTQGISVLFQ